MTVKEAATRLGVSTATIYALCAGRKLRHVRVGVARGLIRISESDIDEYLKMAAVWPDKSTPAPPQPTLVR
jgi:excisionase family DNA binding protein